MEQRNFKSLNLTLFFFLFFLPSPFLLSCLSSLLHWYSLSLEISFIIKLKHDYIYMAVSSVTHRNAKPTTAHCTGHHRYLQIIFNYHAIHLRWSSNGCGLDWCRPVLSTAGGIWTGLVISSKSLISKRFVSFEIVEIINLLVCVFWFRNFLLISHVF